MRTSESRHSESNLHLRRTVDDFLFLQVKQQASVCILFLTRTYKSRIYSFRSFYLYFLFCWLCYCLEIAQLHYGGLYSTLSGSCYIFLRMVRYIRQGWRVLGSEFRLAGVRAILVINQVL